MAEEGNNGEKPTLTPEQIQAEIKRQMAAGPQMIELKCGNCGQPLRIHAPFLLNEAHPQITQLQLIPSWSIEERICRNCRGMVLPVVEKVEINWKTRMPNGEQKRIVVPNFMPPKDIIKPS